MPRGRRRGGGGGGNRSRGPGDGNGRGMGRGMGRASEEIVQQVAAAIVDGDSLLGFECTVNIGGTSPQIEFIKTCSNGDVARLKELVDSMDEYVRESLASVRMEGFGPLHRAAGLGKIDICEYLVEELGFDVNAETSCDSGVTPLSCAVLEGHEIAVKYFLDKGADPNKKDKAGFAPLHEAARKGHDGIARLLLSKGAIVDASSLEGTPLYVSASNGKSSVVQILLEHHADPNKVSANLGTPLAAVLSATPEQLNESECLKCVKLLVEFSADLECTSPDTPLVIATQKGLTECVAYLLEVGAGANNHEKASDKYKKYELKLRGGKAVEAKDYAGATIFYTEAIKLDPADATMFSNRSLCHLKSGRAQDALLDANACIRLKPEWPEGHYRKGAAFMWLKDYTEACTAFLDGTKLDPLNDDMQNAYWEAADEMMKEFVRTRHSSVE
ncbi:hypothetical protein ABZP36_018671 [Zizania latifolia]